MSVICWIDPVAQTRSYESPDGTLHGAVPEDSMKKPMLYFLRHNRDVPSPSPSSPVPQIGFKAVQRHETLEAAVRASDLDEVKRLADESSELDQGKALIQALKSGQNKIARYLLTLDLDVYEEFDGQTPLRAAIQFNGKIAIEIIKKERFILDNQALNYAIFSKNKKLLKALLPKVIEAPAMLQAVAHRLIKGRPVSELLLLKTLLIHQHDRPYELIERYLVREKSNIGAQVYWVFSVGFVLDDPKVLTILDRVFPGVRPEAEAFHHLKLVSNALGLDKTTLFLGKQMLCSGITRQLGPLILKEYLKDFAEQNPKALTGEFLQAFADIHDPNFSLSSIRSKIQSGSPTVIPTGWSSPIGHSVFLVFMGDVLVVCNRGDGSARSPGLNFYRYDPTKLTEKMLVDLLIIDGDKEGINQLLFPGLQCEHILYVPQKDQLSPNCPWASGKSAVYALMLLQRGSDEIQKMKPLHDKMDKSQMYLALEMETFVCYKIWTKFCRVKVSQEHLFPLYKTSFVERSFLKRSAQKMKEKRIQLSLSGS